MGGGLSVTCERKNFGFSPPFMEILGLLHCASWKILQNKIISEHKKYHRNIYGTWCTMATKHKRYVVVNGKEWYNELNII